MSVITITNENDVYDLIQNLESGVFSDKVPEINFSGWPVLTIKLSGNEFDQSITTGVMKGFMELQSNIYKSYATLKYGEPNAQKLTKDERKMLEISVKVEKGSSDLSIDYQQVALEMVSKMTNNQLFTLALVALLLYFGKSFYSMYLEDRKNKRQEEAKSEEDREKTRALEFMSSEETKRLDKVLDIVAREPKLYTISELSKESKASLLKRTSDADQILIDDIELSGDVAEELAKNAVRKSREIRLDGFFEVLMVDTTVKDGFKVKVKNIETGTEFLAIVEDETLDYRNKKAIQNGEWGKTPVYLVINAKQRISDSAITSAIVLQASIEEKELHEP